MKRLLIFISAIQFVSVAVAQVKVPVEKYLGELSNNRYDVVYEDIQKLRKSTRYAKSLILDYFEAKCLCMNGTTDDAFKIFNKMLQSNQLTKETRNFLFKELANCEPNTFMPAGMSATSVSKPLPIPVIPASWHGKLGDVTDCYDYNQFVDFSNMSSPELTGSRVFDKKHKAEAFKQWSQILNNGYHIDTVSNRFIIVTPLNSNVSEIATAVTKLQKGADFYSNYYSLSPPDKLITVFMMPNIKDMQVVSQKIHGIALPSTNLGYSSSNDLTLVGISDIAHVGTIYHELFHLMIRGDIGDIPVWLDEGLACLYATSAWQDNTLLGSYNTWRTGVLKNARLSRDYALRYPSIKLLTSYTLDEFNGTDDQNICMASINYAMANHLMLYFQEKGLLQKVVAAYRNRTVIDLKNPAPYVGNAVTLENAAGEPIDSLDKHFTTWMQKKYNLHLEFNQKTSSVYTFDEIFNVHYFNLTHAMEETVRRDSVVSFNKRIDELTRTYDEQRDTAEIKKFYVAEENRIHGTYDPFVNNDRYSALKELYDEALKLEYDMRKSIFFR